MTSEGPLLAVRDLRVEFPLRTGVLRRTTGAIKAVDGVSFDIEPGRTFGLVGESGSGKTTVGRAILRLIPATSGSVVFAGRNVFALRGEPLRRLRRQMQIVFQDPGGSLDSRMRVGASVAEPLEVHAIARGKEAIRQAQALMERCGLPASFASRFPHELSGGQKQRVAIARSLALQPRLIVCDEPTSALDVSVQSQILNLLKDLQVEFGLSYLFISHNLAVVDHLCDHVAVMQAGRIVESGPREQVIGAPTHPYTRILLDAVPIPDPRATHR